MSTRADGENGDGSGMDDAGWDRDALGVLLAPFTGTEVPAFLAEPLRAGLGGVILFGHNTPDAPPPARACPVTCTPSSPMCWWRWTRRAGT